MIRSPLDEPVVDKVIGKLYSRIALVDNFESGHTFGANVYGQNFR
jgi:hypothetical protein